MRKLTIVNTILVLAVGALVVKYGLASRTLPPQAAHRVSSAQTLQTPGHIDDLLAPVALYPDSLLAQVLLCASDPASVQKLSVWLQNNQTLKGTDLQDAAVVAGFEPSFVALALFPQVVHMMAEKLDWTTLLGQAFAADRSAVFASIQKLRAQARDVGTLKTTAQQEVKTETTPAGQEVIVIEPANPQVVYVPQYNPQVVYVQAPPSTVVVQSTSNADAVAAGMIGFTAGIVIGAAVNNNYYYGPYGWHGGAYMYNDAWDDYYDAREDAREDWQDHREDLMEERGDRAERAQEQRTERQENRTENRPEAQAQRTERQQTRQENRPEAQAQREQRRADAKAAAPQASTRTASTESRGYTRDSGATGADRRGTSSNAFSGYSSGRSERAASTRGQQSRSSSRGGGGRRR